MDSIHNINNPIYGYIKCVVGSSPKAISPNKFYIKEDDKPAADANKFCQSYSETILNAIPITTAELVNRKWCYIVRDIDQYSIILASNVYSNGCLLQVFIDDELENTLHIFPTFNDEEREFMIPVVLV